MTRAAIALALLLLPQLAAANDVPVTDTTTLGAAIAAAMPGDVILLADGTYDSTGYSCNANGTSANPITVKAQHALAATVKMNALEGFKVSGDYWHFEDLVVQGVCPNDDDCEHGFHVNGALGFVLRGSKVSDFNAQVKVNIGAANKLPNGGLIEGNELFDTRARNTANPTTKLDLDSGDDWIVRANVIHDFEKGLGDNTSYGAFLKCGGQRGLMERNLVLCSRDTTGGTRIGLSLGGGGCDPTFCEPAFNAATPCVEHHGGIVRNNIIVNCSDVGIYVNQSNDSHVLYNTLIATTGIDFRFVMSTGEAHGNLLAGMIRNRDSSTGTFANNLENIAASDFAAMYQDPLHGDLRMKGSLAVLLGMGTAVPNITDDYCARTRPSPFDIGAIQHSLGDCTTTLPPSTDGGMLPIDDADFGTVGGTDGGVGGDGGTTSPSSGCACELGGSTPSNLAFVFFVGAWLLRRRARG